MHRICKVLLASAAVVALISGASMLTTREASAQIDIEGMIRGAMSHGYGGYSRHHRGKVHESSHDRRSKDKEDAEDEGPSKDKDDTAGKGDVKPAANRDSGSNKGQQETAASNNSSSGSKPNTETPAFSPSR